MNSGDSRERALCQQKGTKELLISTVLDGKPKSSKRRQVVCHPLGSPPAVLVTTFSALSVISPEAFPNRFWGDPSNCQSLSLPEHTSLGRKGEKTHTDFSAEKNPVCHTVAGQTDPWQWVARTLCFCIVLFPLFYLYLLVIEDRSM